MKLNLTYIQVWCVFDDDDMKLSLAGGILIGYELKRLKQMKNYTVNPVMKTRGFSIFERE